MRNIILSFFLILAVPLSAQFDPANPKIQGVTVLTKTNPAAIGTFTATTTATVGGLSVTTNATVGGTLGVTGNTTLTGDLAVNGGDLTTASGNLTIAPAGAVTIVTGGFRANSYVGSSASGGFYISPISGVYRIDAGVGSVANTYRFLNDADGFAGIDVARSRFNGDVWIAASLLITNTSTPQITIAYDASNKSTETVSSGGDLTIAPSGGDVNITGNLAITGYTTVPTTIITPGTTGNATINKMSGRVNIAATGTSVIVTNSIVTANSIIVAVPATADTTARVTSVVAAPGQFTINTVATTAETAFNFIVITP